MTKKLTVLSLISLFVLFSACGGPKERQAESVLDTPEYHYTQGKKYLEKVPGEKRNHPHHKKGLSTYLLPLYQKQIKSQPGNPHPVSQFEPRHCGANADNFADDLVAGDQG